MKKAKEQQQEYLKKMLTKYQDRKFSSNQINNVYEKTKETVDKTINLKRKASTLEDIKIKKIRKQQISSRNEEKKI